MNILYNKYVLFLRTLIKEIVRPLKDVADIRDYQMCRISEMLKYAVTTVPFYKSYYADYDLSTIKTLEDLRRLPVLKKDVLKKALKEKRILSPEYDIHTLSEASTTGSTGEPTTLYFDSDVVALRNNKIQDMFRAIKLFPYKRFVRVWRQKGMSKMERIFSAQGLFMALSVGDVDAPISSANSNEALTEIAQKLTAFNPHFIRGYVSALYTIARMPQISPEQLPALEGIIASAEYLPDGVWDELEKRFGCPVYNLYGGTEAPAVAISNGYDRKMYLAEDLYFVEVLDDDGNPAKPGEPGYITITDLNSKAMPLIRYQIGDLAVVDDAFHTYTEAKRYLCSVIGRTNDVFQLEDGRLIYSHFWHIYFRDQAWIDKFRVVQETPSKISIKIAPIDYDESAFGVLKASVEAKYVGVDFEWDIVPQIELGPGDKFQAVKSNVAQFFNTVNK